MEPAVPLLPQAVRTQKTLLKPFLSGIHAGVICPWRLGVSEVGHTVIVNVENVAQAGVHPARLDPGSEADEMPEKGMHGAGHFGSQHHKQCHISVRCKGWSFMIFQRCTRILAVT